MTLSKLMRAKLEKVLRECNKRRIFESKFTKYRQPIIGEAKYQLEKLGKPNI